MPLPTDCPDSEVPADRYVIGCFRTRAISRTARISDSSRGRTTTSGTIRYMDASEARASRSIGLERIRPSGSAAWSLLRSSAFGGARALKRRLIYGIDSIDLAVVVHDVDLT